MERQRDAQGQGNELEDVTAEISSCMHTLMQLYQRRSHIHASIAHFDDALLDANAIRNMDPQSPLGYLCMGDVYRQQGRQQEAIDIYTVGMETALSNHPSYPSLSESREAARLQQKKRVDFITQLPFDIVNQYIAPIILQQRQRRYPVNDPWPYLNVSTTWRDRLLRSGRLHYRVQATSAGDDDAFHHYKEYIGSLSLSYVGENGNDNFDTLPWTSMRSLKELDIYKDVFHTGGQATDVLSLVMAIGDRLTHLTLNINGQYEINEDTQLVHLEQILQHTPCLYALDVTGAVVNVWNDKNTVYPHLCLMRIHHPIHAMEHEAVIHLLERFPSLQALTLFRCTTSQALPMIHDYCPSLHYLRYATSCDDGEFSDVDSYDDFYASNSTPGLRVLHLGACQPTTFNACDLMALLERHHETLEEIYISGELNTSSLVYPGVMDMSFPKLNSLHLHDYVYDGSIDLCTLLMETIPHTISIQGNADHGPFSHLKAFTMHLENSVHIQSLHSIVDYYITLGQSSSLTSLSLHFCLEDDDSTTQLLYNIGDLVQLDKFTIDVREGSVSDHSFGPILERFGKRHHRFSRLKLLGDQGISKNVLRHLQCLDIANLELGYGLDALDLVHVLKCKPLESLIIDCSPECSDVHDIVHEHFKDIRVFI